MRIIPYHKVVELDPLLDSIMEEELRFILPSRRDRTWWRKRARRQEFGLSATSACVPWNWEDLYGALCAAAGARPLRQIDPHDHRLILSHLVKETLSEKPELARLWPGLVRPGFLDILSADVRELLNEAVLPEQIEAGLSEGDESLTDQVLPILYRRYLKYLEGNGLVDSSQIPWAARRLLAAVKADWGQDTTLAFTGFMSFTHSQLELIRDLERHCREILILKPETSLSSLQDATRQLERTTWEEEAEETTGRILSLRAAEQSLEPEVLARELALWHSGEGRLFQALGPPPADFGEIGIMTSPGGLRPMKEALSRYAIPHTAERGVGLDETLPGRTIVEAWSLWIQGFSPYETTLYLSHPCFAGPDFPVNAALQSGPSSLKAWKKYLTEGKKTHKAGAKKIFVRALKALDATERFCRTLVSGATPVHIMEALRHFLTEDELWLDALVELPTNHPELDESLRETASAIEAAENKALTLRELLPDIGPIGKKPLRGADAMDFLKSWSRETRIRPELPLSGAVTLCPGPPPVLASWPIWILTDVTQNRWPGKINDSPLLGAAVRERLASASAWLPSPHDKRVQQEALFRRLLQSGDHWTIAMRSELDDKGRPLSDPLFLASFLQDMKGWSLQALSDSRLDVLLSEPDRFFPAVEAAPGDRTRQARPVVGWTRASDVAEQRLSLSVSDVQTLLDCPLRYWLQRKVRLRERSLEIFSDADRGVLLHKFWEEVWGRYEDGTDFMELVHEEWDKLASVRSPYDELGHLLKDPRFSHRLSTLEFQLQRAGNSQERTLQRLRNAGYRHRGLLTEEEAALSWEFEGVIFRGRCDRVDLLEGPDGCLHAVIMDYKAGRGGRDNTYEQGLKGSRPWLSEERNGLKFGLQLSLYALLYSHRHAEHVLSGVGILGHKDGLASGTFNDVLHPCYIEGPSKKISSLEERKEEAEYAARCAVDLMKTGRFPFYRKAASCRWCDMRGICRKGQLFGEAVKATADEDAE